MILRDDHSFVYTHPAPVLLSEASWGHEKEWGEQPSPDEVFSTADLDEFVGTDFSSLRFFVPPNYQPETHTASQYDPYAEVSFSGMDFISHAPLASFDVSLPGAKGGESPNLDTSTIPGFTSEIPSMNSDAEIYGTTHPKSAPGPRFEQDHPPGSSFDVDIYGSAPHNLSPPRGSERSNSPQDNDDCDLQVFRKFDTSTLLYAIPEVGLHSMVFA